MKRDIIYDIEVYPNVFTATFYEVKKQMEAAYKEFKPAK